MDNIDIVSSLFEQMLDAAVIVNAEKTVYHNPAASTMLGDLLKNIRQPQPFMGDIAQYLADGATLYEEEDLPINRALRGEFVKDAEIVVAYADGRQPLWVSVNSGPIKNSAGEVLAAYALLRDMSHRKSVTFEMELKGAKLDLANRELVKYGKLLEEKNRELDDFAHVVSHDLKSPLRGVMTLSEWIVEDYHDKLGEEGFENLNLLMRQVQRMENLINGILAYSRVSKLEVKLEEIDLNKAINEVLELIDCPENIDIKIENELPTINCISIGIKMVFQNLLTNAIKYNDKDFGKINISFVDDASWIFKIYDNGPGIEPVYHDKIFKLFETLNPTDGLDSTGVGLATVKKVVDRHNGKIWVESTPGEGSSFIFSIPK